METRNLPLRILYTINSSPQYILARSHSLIIATIIPRNSDSSHYDRSADAAGSLRLEPHYATTSLKTCLDTICRSSPELVQDFSRDFSVYVLDPLESNSAPAPVHISRASTSSSSQVSSIAGPSADQPRGVAVGLGLMSWALLADETDGTAVTGTLIALPTGKEALEVIFALRETAAMQKSSLPTALRSWGLPPQPPSKLSRVHASKSHRESKHPLKQSRGLPVISNNGRLASPRFLPPNQNTGTSLRQGSSSTLPNTLGHPDTSEPSTSGLTPSPSPPCDTPGPFSASTLATLASIRMRAQAAKPLKPRKTPAAPTPSPSSEADKMMLTKEIYIGPVKKKGRPAKGFGTITDSETDLGGNAVASGSSSPSANYHTTVADDANKGETSDLSSSSQSLNSTLGTNSNEPHTISSDSGPESTMRKTKTTKKRPRQDAPLAAALLSHPKPSEPVSLLDVLAHISASATSNLPNSQNAALLAALSTIDAGRSDSHSDSVIANNPALINALRDLISATYKQVSSQAVSPQPPNPSPRSHLHHRSHSQDDEIVVLDKENVNPSAFRRRAERDAKQIDNNSSTSSNGLAASPQIPIPVPTALPEQASPNRTLSIRSNGRPTPALTPLQNNSSSAGEKRRKRTLSDFMDERESGRSGKSRERELAERRDAHRHTHSSRRNSSADSSASSMRHYSRLNTLDGLQRRDRSGTNSYYRTGMEPFTSPPRPINNNRTNLEGENTRLFVTLNKSPQGPRASASSPVRPSSRAPKRKYVVPDWARTQTSTQPRLSEAAQKALEEADERKREERGAKRKTAPRVEKDKSKRTACSTSPSRQATEDESSTRRDPSPVPQQNLQLPLPVAASNALPVFSAASEITLPIRPSTPELSLAASSSSTTTIPFPSTPPRRRSGMIYSPDNGGDSLFTPTPRSNNFAGSPLFSPHQPLASPLGSRAKGSSLSTQGILIGRRINGWGSSSQNHEAGDEEDGEDIEDALNRELDSALEELETSSSLPVAKTDLETNKRHPTTLDETLSPPQQFEDDADQSDSHSYPIKQHWAGLPPSSPPPPTSPVLMPHGVELESDTRSDDDDMDDMELPVATSDAEEYFPDSEAISGYPNVPDLSSYTNEELTAYLSNNDFSLLFPSLVDNAPSSDMDVFDQFTNLNAQSDGSCGEDANMNVDVGFENTFENGLADFDFTQFWETFKPLVQDHMSENDDHGSSSFPREVAHGIGQIEELDHAKLAEDVQALFSGCLM